MFTKSDKSRLAFICGIFPAISEPFLINVVAGLIEEGIDLEVFANSFHASATEHKNFKHYTLSSKTTYFPKVTLNTIINDMMFQLKHLGIRQFLSVHRGIVTTRSEYKLARVKLRSLLEYEPDTLYCNFIGTGISYMFLREMGLVNKMVVGVYGGDVSIQNLNYPYQQLFEIADQFIAISNHIKSRLVKLGCDESKISVIPLPVDTDEFTMNQHESVSDRFQILSVGRLVEKKGFVYGINAIKKLVDNGIAVKYTIVGDGPLFSDLNNVIHKLGLDEYINMVGMKNHYELQDYYQSADVVLVPSVTAQNGDMEGQVVVIQEAGLVGLPVVASTHNGIPDGVINGETGFLTPEKDVLKLSEALNLLNHDPDRCRKMGEDHRKFVLNHYSRKVISERITKIIMETN